MKYCENCHIVTDFPRCPACGAKVFREVREEDFCLLLERLRRTARCLRRSLKRRIFPALRCLRATGSALRSGCGWKMKSCLCRMRSCSGQKRSCARSPLGETERLRGQILQNADALHMAPRLARKLAKKWKAEDVLNVCKEKIASARRIEDGGRRLDGPGSGHFLFCYADGATLCVDSESLEILSVTFS